MAPSLSLSDDQRFALMKFRRSVADCTQPHHDDHFLLRWLKARNYNPEAAEKMLRESLKWREMWEIETLQTWDPPEVIKKYYPSGSTGFDKEGSPVVIIPFAGLDMWGMMHSISKADFIRQTIKMIEHYTAFAREQSKTYGQNATQVSVIIDMDNFNLRQYAWRPAGEVVISLIQMYEANYPEILKTCFIINAPKIFALAFSVVKNFLNEYTIRKIRIFKNDPNKYQPLILAEIDAEQLPVYFGGKMTDPDGDIKCSSKIHQGGKIPKTYYSKNNEKLNPSSENLTTVMIKKGDKLKLPFLVIQEGSFIKWEFHTEGHDIKFGVIRKDEEGKDTVVVPIHRVNSHETEEVGVVTCPTAATYIMVFDNSYSYLRNKKLHYSIIVAPPINTTGCDGNDNGEMSI